MKSTSSVERLRTTTGNLSQNRKTVAETIVDWL
jgi:hypothetical protein